MTSTPYPLRGQVFEVELGSIGRKLWLVVSNNQRNRALDDVLTVRLTTSPKPAIPTVVELTPADGQFVGRVLCDDIGPLFKDELGPAKGALSPATMRRVDLGLRAALATG